MTMNLRRLILGLARRFGSTIRDPRTGKVLGKALLLPWNGRIHVIGLETTVRPQFLPQERETYWKQELGFAEPEKPDYPNERQGS